MSKRWIAWGIGLPLLGLLAGFLIWAGFEASLLAMRMDCFSRSRDASQIDIATAPDGRVRFAALGDTGTGKPAQRAVARAVRRWCKEKGCDFIALLGDNFYPAGLMGASDPRFQTLVVRPYGPLNVPIVAILGNHDVNGDAIHQVQATERFPLWRMPNFRFDFRVGPAQFHAVNTNCGVLEWLRHAPRLEPPPAWTFVLAHEPPYGTGDHGDSNWESRLLWNWLVEPRADFVLSGHNHVLEVLRVPGRPVQYVVTGSSGGGGEKKSGGPRPRRESAAKSQFYAAEPGFAWFEVSATQVRGHIVNQRGESLFEFGRSK